MTRSRSRRWARWAVALCIVFVAGCGDISIIDTRQVGRGQVSLRPLLDTDSLAVPGVDPSNVVDALGEPESTEERRPPKDQRPGTVTVMRYEELEIVVHELRRPPRSFISNLVISSGRYVTNLPVGVGATRTEIDQVLGQPSEVEGNQATYALTDDGSQVIVTYNGTRASRMLFQFA